MIFLSFKGFITLQKNRNDLRNNILKNLYDLINKLDP